MSDDAIYTVPKDDLPPMWELKSIHDLVGKKGVFVDGDWVESKDQDPNGDVRLIQLADVGDGGYRNKSNRFLTVKRAKELGCTFLQKGDVLIARMPDPLGRACIFPGDAKQSVTVVDVAIVRPGNNSFDTKWLMYFINAPAFRSAVASLEAGSTRKRISRKNLGKIYLPVPPLPQQKRIVAEIDTQFSRLDETVASLKRIQANLKRYKAAVLKAAVEGKLTEQWRKDHPDVEPADQLLKRILAERRAKWEAEELAKMKAKGIKPKDDSWKKKYKEPAGPDTANLPELPEGWVWASPVQLDSGEAYATAIGPFGSNLKVSDYQTEGVPLVFVRNIRSRIFSDSKNRYIDLNKSQELRPHWVRSGDILVTKMGEPPGDATCYPEGKPIAVITADCLKITLSSLIVESRGLFAHAINSEVVKQQITNITQGVAQQKISLARFSQIGFPLPPLLEQKTILEEVDSRISVTEELEATIETNLKRAEHLRQTILQRAFSGGLV